MGFDVRDPIVPGTSAAGVVVGADAREVIERAGETFIRGIGRYELGFVDL